MRLPVRVNDQQTDRLRAVLQRCNIEAAPGYKVFVTDTQRGRCNYESKYITVPFWATIGGPNGGILVEFEVYYAAHECAHSWCFEDTGERNHGGTFMEWFKLLCPEHLWHHELGYKPRLAAAAGIERTT